MGKKYLDENGLAYFWSKLKQYLATTSRAGLMSPTDKAKVDAITNQGTVSYHKKYEGTFTTTGSSTSTIPIPISSYSTADILLVDINGLDLVENTDYTISGTDIVLTNPITESGQIVHFVAVRATTASVSDYALLKGDAGVVDAYPISGATPLSASWLSDTSGGSALTPEANQIYILMSDSGDYTANALFRWNGSAYVPLTSGGSVTSTSVPTANTISEFDSDAHMNSEDMTAQEVQDFVDNLDVSGGGVTVVQDIQTVFFTDSSQTIGGGGAVTREGLSLASVVPSGYTPIFASFRFVGSYLTVCYTCTINAGLLTYQIANRSSSSITITPAFQILCVKKTQ